MGNFKNFYELNASGCVRGLHQPRPPAPGPAVPGGGQGRALREAAGHQPAGDPAAGAARQGQGGVPHGGHLEQVHPSLQGKVTNMQPYGGKWNK